MIAKASGLVSIPNDLSSVDAAPLLQPRESFKGHAVDTPWTRLQLAYFVGYAMWTYLNTPFLFALDGVKMEEIEPWRENGETWSA